MEDAIRGREVALVINSPEDEQSQYDDAYVRRAAIMNGVPYFGLPKETTRAGGIVLPCAFAAAA